MRFVTNNLFSVFVILATTFVAHAQTSAQLRARYGEPQTTELKNGRPAVERFLVRTNIQMTIRYTDEGEPCEANLKPVPNSTAKTGRPEHALDGDYMSTAEVITVINESLPAERRGKKIQEFHVNGGDPEMKLHHVGCTGMLIAQFENATVNAASWCWGGTISVTIRWGKTSCSAQVINQKANNFWHHFTGVYLPFIFR